MPTSKKQTTLPAASTFLRVAARHGLLVLMKPQYKTQHEVAQATIKKK